LVIALQHRSYMGTVGKKEEPTWVVNLRTFLREQNEIQAIRISPETHKVSVATFGKAVQEDFADPLKELLKGVEIQMSSSGSSESPFPVDGLWMRSEEDGTILEKTQCPTVRSLWTWRDYEWLSDDHSVEESEEDWKFMALMASICGVSLIGAFIVGRIAGAPEWLIFVLYGIALISGGWDAAVDTFQNLKRGQVDIHFLMLSVALGAVAIGSWAEGALLLFLFSLSGALEHFAEHRTHREIDALTKAAPKTANVLNEDGTVTVRPVETVRPGELLRVKPDELFPVDGEVIDGKTASDESNLTGEATPVEKLKGDSVYSGTLNMWGVVTVRVERQAAESSLQKIIRLIQDSQRLKAPSQRFTDKFGTGYTYLILGLTTAFFLFNWLVLKLPAFEQTGETFSAFYRAMTFLVVASPCALVLSIPSAILAAIAWGARKGILFRGGAAIEKLAEVDVVAMDKTGTLTQGDLTVTGVESFPEGRADQVLQRAFSLERIGCR
jgi:Zn2+/Cd2+-exporting ATPase